MAAHSSVLACRIPGTGEPGGLLSVGSHRVGHDWSNLAAAAAVKAVVFPVVMDRCERWTIRKEVKPVNPKGNQPWIFIGKIYAEAEAPMLWPPDARSRFIAKDSDAGKEWRQRGKGMTEDEMIGWHHWLSEHEFEQTLGGSEEQWSPVCCSPWCHKESDTSYRLTEQLQILLLSNLLNCYFLFKHYYCSSDTNIYWHKFLFQNCFTSV